MLPAKIGFVHKKKIKERKENIHKSKIKAFPILSITPEFNQIETEAIDSSTAISEL